MNILRPEQKINNEQDFMDLLSQASEVQTNRLLIPFNMLSDDFFDLKTGLAGTILQKITNYQMKTALVIPENVELNDRVKELLSEMNKGEVFRSFLNIEKAKEWLNEV